MDSPNTLFATDPDALILKTEKLVMQNIQNIFLIFSKYKPH
jgi:hypothetical protein